MNKKTIFSTLLISVLLFVAGIYLFGNLYEVILPQDENVSYQTIDIGGDFRTLLICSIVLGLTPILILITWQLTPIVLTRNKMSSIAIVVACMILSILVRQQMIKSFISRYATNDTLKVGYPIDQIQFEYYLLGGVCIGCLISFMLFSQKKHKIQ